MTEKCTKDSIRKESGATINEIMRMLNLVFIKWLGIAFHITTPVSGYAAKNSCKISHLESN